MKELETKTEAVARLELQAKSIAQKIVREKVEEHKHKKDVKHRELQGLHQGLPGVGVKRG